MILLIDNYDSFVYNLYQYLSMTGVECHVVRNDALDLDAILKLSPRAIVLSPGPGRPEDAGICLEVIQKLSGQIPIFGVCLGHQAIAQAFGARIGYAPELMHGKTSEITHQQNSLFEALPSPMTVARYHSLVAEPETLPDCLEAIAQTADGTIMAIQHREYPVYGVQFHPESIASQHGMEILKNFLALAGVLP